MKYILFIFLPLLIYSCKPKLPGSEVDQSENLLSDNQISLSYAQMNAINLKLDSIRKRSLESVVQANGYIDVPPYNKAVISPFVTGHVREVKCLVGNNIKKGEVMAVLESIEFVEMQQQYIELEARLQYLEDEYKRQETLQRENAVAKKKYLISISDYKSALSQYSGLKEKLKLIGIDFTNLEQGNITSLLYLRAPINGNVTEVMTVVGRHVDPHEEIFEIMNPDHLHLELNVYEKDILKVKKGQKVLYSIPSMDEKVYEGEVFLVSQNMQAEQRFINVHIHINEDDADFKVGMYVNASIVIDHKSVYSLPVNAIVTESGREYIYMKMSERDDQMVFEKKQVITGLQSQGLIELKLVDDIDLNKEIVTEGAFYLSNAFVQPSE
jgi:cobalt-zinc-cadmium efflux system membrane fusion protein